MPNALRTNSATSAARFLELRQTRAAKHKAWRERWKIDEVDYLRGLVRSKVGRLVPKTQRELHVDVENEYGPVAFERVARHVRWLVARGEVIHVEGGFVQARQRRG